MLIKKLLLFLVLIIVVLVVTIFSKNSKKRDLKYTPRRELRKDDQLIKLKEEEKRNKRSQKSTHKRERKKKKKAQKSTARKNKSGNKKGKKQQKMKKKEIIAKQKKRLEHFENQLRIYLTEITYLKQEIGNLCVYAKVSENETITNKVTNRDLIQQICRTSFVFRVVDMAPYSSPMTLDLLKHILTECCGGTIRNITVQHATSISGNGSSTLDRDVDFIYPVFAYTRSFIVYGYYYIPLLDPPGAFYITIKTRFEVSDLLKKCVVDLWPVLLLGMLMAILAGFVAWILETWDNEEEFQRPFVRGWFEGVWWSFISMTTVGYGDKSPRSVGGRIFSIIWIIVGIIIFCIMAGEITTIIMNANKEERREMAGERVGVLKNRLYDRGLVTRNGGVPVAHPSNDESELSQLYWLIEQLKHDALGGFLLDKYTFWIMKGRIQQDLDQDLVHHYKDFFLHDTVTTNVPHSGDEVSYGVLVKNKQHHVFFNPVFKGNKLFLQTVVSSQNLYYNPKEKKESLFKRILKHNVVFFSVAIGLILVVGLIAESYRNKRQLKQVSRKILVGVNKQTVQGEDEEDEATNHLALQRHTCNSVQRERVETLA